MEFSQLQLIEIVTRAAEFGARRGLESSGTIKPRINLAEAYRRASRTEVDRARRNGTLDEINKGGKTSRIYFDRAKFEIWAMKSELTFKI